MNKKYIWFRRLMKRSKQDLREHYEYSYYKNDKKSMEKAIEDIKEEFAGMRSTEANIDELNKIFTRHGFIVSAKELSKGITKKSKLTHLFAIVPSNSREEAILDIQEIMSDMKNNGCSKPYINMVIILHLASVIYHGLFFKLKDYFYPITEQSKK